ncbi:hypothetical protein AAG570_006060 [Ranatra chinensis]|uniref:Uncharacterized protein n=1 Tax=Ranatra chinensis TaxID=642074 RepID=A0ABD0XYP9_9HEMI
MTAGVGAVTRKPKKETLSKSRVFSQKSSVPFSMHPGYVLGVYLPARELEVTVTQSRVRPGEEVTRVGALLYSGAAARGALYTVSSPHYHGINVTANGTLLWNRSRITPGLNMTLNVEASYKSEISRTLLKVHVVKDPEDPCKLSTMPIFMQSSREQGFCPSTSELMPTSSAIVTWSFRNRTIDHANCPEHASASVGHDRAELAHPTGTLLTQSMRQE